MWTGHIKTSNTPPAMLRASIDNAQDDMERRLLTEARVEARRGVNAVQAALEERRKRLLGGGG